MNNINQDWESSFDYEIHHGMIHLFIYTIERKKKWDFNENLLGKRKRQTELTKTYGKTPYLHKRRLIKHCIDLFFVKNSNRITSLFGEAIAEALFFKYTQTSPLMIKMMNTSVVLNSIASGKIPIAIVIQENN